MPPMLSNPLVTGRKAEALRQERREAQAASAYRELRAEFVTGLFDNTLQPIRTPAFRDKRMRLVDVVADMCGAADELRIFESMLRLVVSCAEGEEPATRLPAQALIARLAHTYASYHADDAATLQEENGDAP